MATSRFLVINLYETLAYKFAGSPYYIALTLIEYMMRNQYDGFYLLCTDTLSDHAQSHFKRVENFVEDTVYSFEECYTHLLVHKIKENLTRITGLKCLAVSTPDDLNDPMNVGNIAGRAYSKFLHPYELLMLAPEIKSEEMRALELRAAKTYDANKINPQLMQIARHAEYFASFAGKDTKTPGSVLIDYIDNSLVRIDDNIQHLMPRLLSTAIKLEVYLHNPANEEEPPYVVRELQFSGQYSSAEVKEEEILSIPAINLPGQIMPDSPEQKGKGVESKENDLPNLEESTSSINSDIVVATRTTCCTIM